MTCTEVEFLGLLGRNPWFRGELLYGYESCVYTFSDIRRRMEGIPMALLHASEGLLFLFSQWAILIIEFSGGLILVWGAFSGLKLLLHKQKNLPVKVRIALA